MLVIPDLCPVYRILAIDPGTDTLGIAILELDLLTAKITVIDAWTVVAHKLIVGMGEFVETHGPRAARLYAHELNLIEVLKEWKPHAVIAESPYFRRFPQPYAALVECMVSIRRAVMTYSCSIQLETVDPPSAKKAVGVVAKGSKKEDIRKAIKRLVAAGDIDVYPDLDYLDEHSTDAIAVGLFKVQAFI